jgi:hypothetical protein
MDGQAACRQGCRASLCRIRVAYDRAAGSKKNELQPHLSKYWKIPPEGSAAFVAHMEDVLDIYHLPYDNGWAQNHHVALYSARAGAPDPVETVATFFTQAAATPRDGERRSDQLIAPCSEDLLTPQLDFIGISIGIPPESAKSG